MSLRVKEIGDVFNRIAKSFDKTRRKPWRCAIEAIEGLTEGRILDAGCGNGRHLLLLSSMGFRVVGVDLSKELIRIAKRRIKEFSLTDEAELIVGDIRFLPFKDEVFDGVLAIAVIHHIPGVVERVRTLKDMKRVMKPHAKAVLTAWSIWSLKRLWRAVMYKFKRPFSSEFGDAFIPWRLGSDTVWRFYHLFTAREFRKIIENAGLKAIKSYGERKKYGLFPENLVVVAVKIDTH